MTKTDGDTSDYTASRDSFEAGGDLLTSIASIVSAISAITAVLPNAGALTDIQNDLDTITGANGAKITDDGITSAKFDESTAFPVKSADTGSTKIARTGADSDTLETLSDEIATIASGGVMPVITP